MASFNQIILLGNVGNLEVKTFSNGGKMVEASLATGKRWTDRNGNAHEETQWHKIVISGNLADTAEQYISKGDPLFVVGEMTYRQWETREGEKRSSPEVRVTSFQLLPKGMREGQASNSATSRPAAPAPAPAAAPAPLPGLNGAEPSDDLPF